MADNRIYLKCDNCGAGFILGKRSISGGYYSAETPEKKGKGLYEFFDTHAMCDAGTNRPYLSDVFSIDYEGGRDSLADLAHD